jgi:hypothetical protein
VTDVPSIELTVYRIMAETGLSAAELLALPPDEYARVTGRETPGQVAIRAAGHELAPPARDQAPAADPAPGPPVPEPQGIDVSHLTLEQYARLRGQLGIGVSHKEGRGIFDSAGSRSTEYIAGARSHSGRTALSSANVTEAPRLTGRYVRQDDHRDTRPPSASPVRATRSRAANQLRETSYKRGIAGAGQPAPGT